MAANSRVFRGSDATLTLSLDNPDFPESQEANTVIEFFELATVGRASQAEVYVTTDLKAYHEIGRRHPAQLRPGNINISGKLSRAYINGGLIHMLLGKGSALNRVAEPYPQPTFNLQFTVRDPAFPDTSSVITVHGVKFDDWNYILPEDDFVMEDVTFQGMFITAGDTVSEQ
jgi:hypothetical protein